MHAALIAVHAAAATVSLLGALVLLLPRGLPGRGAGVLAAVVAVATGLMAVSLAGAVMVGWAEQPVAEHVVFGALTVLAAAAAVCAVAAVPAAGRRAAAALDRLYGAGGFVLITQVTGFVAIAVLEVLPTWGVVAASVGTVLGARSVVARLRTLAVRRGGVDGLSGPREAVPGP